MVDQMCISSRATLIPDQGDAGPSADGGAQRLALTCMRRHGARVQARRATPRRYGIISSLRA